MNKIEESKIVTFKTLGENFSLRVPQKLAPSLEESVKKLNEKVNERLNNNPGLTPLQCAILVALDCINELDNNNNTESEFYKKVLKEYTKLNKIAKSVEQ